MQLLTGLILSILMFLNLGVSDLLCADRLEKSFPASSGGQLTILSEGSRIDIEGANVNNYSITMECKKPIEEYYEVNFASTSNGLKITVEKKKKTDKRFWIFGSGNTPSLKISVIAPFETVTDLKTSGGSIKLSELSGSQSAKTSGGSITCKKIDGTVTGRTSGGSIRCHNINGDLEVTTSGGSITLADINGSFYGKTSGGSISAERVIGDGSLHTSGGGITVKQHQGSIESRTSGGRIRAEFSSPPIGDCDLRTSGGGITFSMPHDSGINLYAKTSGGSVSTDFDVLVKAGTRKKSQLAGEIGGGGPQVSLRTSGGSIRISESN